MKVSQRTTITKNLSKTTKNLLWREDKLKIVNLIKEAKFGHINEEFEAESQNKKYYCEESLV